MTSKCFLVVVCLLLVACQAEPTVTTPDRTLPERAIPAWQLARQNAYLAYACAEELHPNSAVRIMLHHECLDRGMPHGLDDIAIPPGALDADFEKMWNLRDTSDFTATMLINLLYGYRASPYIPQEVWNGLEQALTDFKYWYTDPTPARTTAAGENVVDKMWYWSENHILIFRVCEYLAGQYWPEKVFSVTGLTGREHMQRARHEIERWIEERARWGFSEWHSDVYYNWDMQPLMALIEWSDDRQLAHKAAMVMDLVWLDEALHTHKGTNGATHGRSYIKDKPAAVLQDTFVGVKIMFDDTSLDWSSAGSSNGLAMARTRRYELPQVLRTIAVDDSAMEDRERMNLPIDERPPASADAPVAPAPYGLDWEDEDNLPLWWSMSAQTVWPMIPATIRVTNREDLWAGPLAPVAPIAPLFAGKEDSQDIRDAAYPLYVAFWQVLTEPLLKEVNTYTYRTSEYMLSSAQDYRKGLRSTQTHIWQATLDETAVVFTTHPGEAPIKETDGTSPQDWDWHSDQHGGGYWTGHAALPRMGQHKNVAIALYAPQYEPVEVFGLPFGYLYETHAYFPHAHFDEVMQEGHWTFGRKGDAYIGLYSYRDTHWRTGQPAVYQNAGQPFELVADGGADNVWIAELGSAAESGSFAAFRLALAAAAVAVTDTADLDENGYPDGYSVAYDSPSLGLVTFDWVAPLKVDGTVVPLGPYKRYDNPYVQTDFDTGTYNISFGGQSLVLDFDAEERTFKSALD